MRSAVFFALASMAMSFRRWEVRWTDVTAGRCDDQPAGVTIRRMPRPAAPGKPGPRSAAEGGHDLGAEAAHRVGDLGVPEIAEAHLAEHVAYADALELPELFGHAPGGAAERAGLQRPAHALVLRHRGIGERVEHRG